MKVRQQGIATTRFFFLPHLQYFSKAKLIERSHPQSSSHRSIINLGPVLCLERKATVTYYTTPAKTRACSGIASDKTRETRQTDNQHTGDCRHKLIIRQYEQQSNHATKHQNGGHYLRRDHAVRRIGVVSRSMRTRRSAIAL